MKITNRHINRIVQESINRVLCENFDDVEDVPTFDVINENMSFTNIGELLESYLYDKNDNCIGRLNDLHFKYNPESNCFLGTRSM